MEGVFSFSFEGQRLIHNYPPKTTALGGARCQLIALCAPLVFVDASSLSTRLPRPERNRGGVSKPKKTVWEISYNALQ